MIAETAPLQKGQSLELEVSGLAAGGRGLARAPDGRAVFVAGGLAGERVRARLTRLKREYAEASAQEVLSASPQRVPPPCPLYGRCGGCSLQHLDYPAQVAAKAAWVQAALARLGPLPAVQQVASPSAWGYRQRVRLAASQNGLGFFAAGSKDVVPLGNCPVAAEGVNRLLPGLAEGLGQIDARHISWLEVLAGQESAFVTLGLDPRRPLSNRWRAELRRLCRRAGAAATRLAWGRELEPWDYRRESGLVYYADQGLEMTAFPGLFVQANFAANQRLVELVLAAAQEAPPGPALDLYAGSGNFGLPLAQAGRPVLAVEASDEALEAAAWQAEQAGLAELMELRAGDATAAAAELAQEGRALALAVLDPPRAGAREVMEPLARLAPARIIYVSCHPAALARDAAVLLQAGYQAAQVWAVDMFPHAGHTEAMLVLDRA